MHDVAWRGMWICVRSKDAQKQLARTSLIEHYRASFSWGIFRHVKRLDQLRASENIWWVIRCPLYTELHK